MHSHNGPTSGRAAEIGSALAAVLTFALIHIIDFADSPFHGNISNSSQQMAHFWTYGAWAPPIVTERNLQISLFLGAGVGLPGVI